MIKIAISALTLLAVSFASLAPARADEPKEMLKNTAMFPVKALAVSAGLVFGTPVAVVRQTTERSKGITSAFADEIGGKDSLPPVLFASLLGVPFGVLVGTGEGVYFGGKNAIEHGVEKPFSKDSFSLGELE